MNIESQYVVFEKWHNAMILLSFPRAGPHRMEGQPTKEDAGHDLGSGKVGQVYTVTRVGGQGAARRRLLDFGVLPGTVVEIIRAAPLGDPVELRLRGYTTLRRADGAQVTVGPPAARREEGRTGYGDHCLGRQPQRRQDH